MSDLLDKVSDGFTVNMCTNGYVVEASGRVNDDWRTVKVVCTSEDELFSIIRQLRLLPRDE